MTLVLSLARTHLTLATIQDFHRLTGREKTEVASQTIGVLETIPVPGSVRIERARFVQYRHRSLAQVDHAKETRFGAGGSA